MEVLIGNRAGSSAYIHNNFVYHKHRVNARNGDVSYRCCRRNCHARLKEVRGEINEISGHNHINDIEEVSRLRLKTELRHESQLAGNQRKLRKTFDDVCERHQNASESIGYPGIRSTMYRAKGKNIPPVPHSLQEFADTLQMDEWSMFGKTKGDPPQPFFHRLLENPEENWTAVLFISPKLVEVLGTTNRVHIDATFQVVPAELQAYQLMTVHVLFSDHFLPAAYILTTRKTEACYKGVLQEILSVCPASRQTVSIVMTDFETGLMNAASEAWPNAEIIGCFFHFAQAVYRKHVSLHLKPLTDASQQAKRALKMLMALALLPDNSMLDGLREVWQFAVLHGFNIQFQPMIDYMNDFWLETIGANRCSVFGQAHRTNNSVEGFYSYLFDRMRSKPSVWGFTEELRSIEFAISADYSRLMNGHNVKYSRKKKYKRQDERVRQAWAAYGDRQLPTIQFLFQVSHVVADLEERLRGAQLEEAVAPQGLDAPAAPQAAVALAEPEPEEIDADEDLDEPQVFDNPAELNEPVAYLHDLEEAREIDTQWARLQSQDIPLMDTPATDQDLECLTCGYNVRTYTIVPCGHLVMCSLCVHQHRQGRYDNLGLRLLIKCPYCQHKVDSYMRTFINI